MAKINKKVTKGAETDVKLAKVNAKSVTIQKADKKPIKNLKEKAEKAPAAVAAALTKKVKATSPKKQKKEGGKGKNLQKKTKATGGSPIVPKKNAKKMLKAGAIGQSKSKELVSKDDLAKCVTAFRSAIQLGLAEKKAMLDPDFKYILQLCSFKVPQCPERIARTQLTHSLVDETDDICLFVKDVEAGNKRDYQPTIDYFREKLDAAGITNVKTIMPISQLSKDYKQHEMIRKLCSSYDCFLTDGRIAPPLAKKLGKTFVVHKKSPISVRLNHPQLKAHFASAIAKVAYSQTSSGDSVGIHVAKHGMEDEQVVENIQRLLNNMKTEFPGGWANVKRVYLRPAINLSKSSILVYANASSGKDVVVPVIEGPRAKAVAEKQKKLNELLPDGLVMTNKGELAIVGNRKRPAEKEEASEKPAAKKNKKQSKDEEKKAKKSKKGEAVVVAEEVPVVEAPVAVKKNKKNKDAVATPAPVAVVAAEEEKKSKGCKKSKAVVPEEVPAHVVADKKAKKDKKKAAPVEVAVEEVPVVAEKKNKSKKAAVAVEETPAVAPEKKSKKAKKSAEEVVAAPVESAKPAKKGKKKAVEPEAGDLTQEVSDLWEQIKNESAAELGELEPKKAGKGQKNKRKAETQVVAEEKKSNKKEAPAAAGDKKKKQKK